MGLWGPLPELEDDLHRMKAISTVGSGLRHKQLFLKSDECSILVAFTVSVKEPKQFRVLFSYYYLLIFIFIKYKMMTLKEQFIQKHFWSCSIRSRRAAR